MQQNARAPRQVRNVLRGDEDLLEHAGDFLFRQLARLTPSAHVKPAYTHSVDLLPKRSKALGTNLIKDVMKIEESRLLVITGHLYLDYILYRMLAIQGNVQATQADESFSRRLKLITGHGWMLPDHVAAMKELNQLRNRFAHDVFFDFASWDPSSIPYFARCAWRRPNRRYLRLAFNKTVVRLTFVSLLIEMSCRHDWLNLEDVPERARRGA